MTTRKTLVWAGLVLFAFPLRHAELLSRVADDCKCDRKQLSCKILCSGIGSGPGTGGAASTFDVAPGVNRPAQERPIIVPRTEGDTKSPPAQIK
jgi:hypothetical protein